MSKLKKKKLERRLNKFINGNKFENAIEVANQLSKLCPDNNEYILTKAECFESLEKYEEAAKEYKNYLKTTNKTIDDYIITCSKLEQIRMYEDGLDVINEGLKIYPNNKMLVMDKAIVLAKADEIEQAFEYIDAYSKTDDYWKDLQFIKADIKLGSGNSIEAMEICDKILEDGMDRETLSKKIEILVKSGSIDEAKKIINPLLKDENEKNWAASIKAAIYDENNEVDKAFALLDDFLKRSPENKQLLRAKGLLLLSNGEFEEGEEYLRDSFTKEDDNPEYETEIDLKIAIMFLKSGYFYRALELAESIPEESKHYAHSQVIQNRIHDEMKQDQIRETEEIGEDFFTHDFRTPFERSEFQEDNLEVYELIDMAWSETNLRKQKKLAKKAIDLDKYAIDAYNILAYNTNNPDLKMKYYKKAMALFRETHDDEYFEDLKGYFWSELETRPFMRAMEGYVDGLVFFGNEKEAVDLYKYMLELNPGDNQGIRYSLINALLVLNRLKEVSNVFDQYGEEHSSQFLFSKLLWAIKSGQDVENLKILYLEAVESNKHVVPLLLGKNQIPTIYPKFYSPGDSYEAVEYIHLSHKAWKQDKTALKILEKFHDTYIDL